jgi:ABC-type transport system substrate-binding protein
MSRLPFSLATAALLAAGCMGGAEPDPAAVGRAAAPTRPFAELRVAVSHEPDLDPQLAITQESWRLVRLLHLGILDLAAEPPAISDDSRSYLFQLPRGTGVRPSDFAAALERLRELDSPAEHWFAGLEEVRADDDALTVEYQLSEPDASFLTKLATPLLAPRKPTGPYVTKDGLVFRRNPSNRTGNPAVIRVVEEGWDVAPAAGPPSVSYLFLHTQLAPFDRMEVRRAVALALDRRALARAVGGRPTANVLPPSIAGYVRRPLGGRVLRRVEADEPVTVWAASRQPAGLIVQTLEEIGLDASLRVLPPADFFRAVAGRSGKAQAVVSSWSSPLPHPLVWFDALLNGDRISESPNTNLSHADDPELNEEIARLREQPLLTDEVAAAWAELDRLAVEQALVIPFAVRAGSAALGRRVDRACVVVDLVYGVDLARVCVR